MPSAMRCIAASISLITSREKARTVPRSTAVLRDHVVGVAGMDLGDRQHGRIDRRDIARHHALQRRRDVGGDDHRIDAGLRPRAVRALAGDVDVEEGAARHHRARADGELADVEARPVVHAEDRVAREPLEQPVLDHRLGAADALLGGLEDEIHGAVEIARRGEVPGGAQQHRGVAVVAAGMHAALVRRAVIEGVRFLHRQRVHVGAQADRPAPLPTRSTPTTPVLPMPRWTSMPNSLSFAATRSAVRFSSNPSSGCAWMSRRQRVSSGWNSAMRSKADMAGSRTDGTGVTVSAVESANRQLGRRPRATGARAPMPCIGTATD